MGSVTAEAGAVDGALDRLGEGFAALADGDATALGLLYDALANDVHALALWRTGSPAEAADVLQEVFVRLAQAGPRLRSVRDPRAYTLRVTHRCAVDVHRRHRRRGETRLEEARLVEAAQASPEREIDARRATRLLLELPDKQREAVWLHLFAGCSFAEAARVAGVPTFTAASRFRLGLARLRRLMGVSP
jgi:RNA polymerase sigma-70 factor (ECF subfamily)